MKLITLEVQAFGPFRNKETVEFNKLGKEPLFLIDGPTGAGKSSILNAISFALYGDLADKDRNNEGLRCDFSDDDIETKVSLKFQLRGVTYQITRSPTQLVKKKIGDGFRERPGEAELLKVGTSGNDVLVPKKMKEATDWIEKIIGLDKNQFIQVMVLPQGKFRELLLASSDQRQKILSTLFGTKRFKDMETLLKEKSKEVVKKYEFYQSKIESILKDIELKYTELDKLDWLIVEAKKYLNLSKEGKEKAQNKREENSNKLEIANNTLKTFFLYDQKKEEYENTLKKKKDFALIREQIFKAEEAGKMKATFNVFINCEKSVSNIQKDISSIKNERVLSRKWLDEASFSFDKAEETLKGKDDLLKRGLELEGFYEKSINVENTHAKYQKLKKSFERENNNFLKLKNDKEKNNEDLKKIDKETYFITNSLSKKADYVKSESNLERILAKREELEEIVKKVNKEKKSLVLLENNLFNINDELKKAQEEADLLEMKWHNNQAFLLAKKLKQGEPCPVCGSEEHPRPLVLKTELIDKEVVDEARKKEKYFIREKNNLAVEAGKINILIEKFHESEEVIEKELGHNFNADVLVLKNKLGDIKNALNEIEKNELRLKTLNKNKEDINHKCEEREKIILHLNDNVLPHLKGELIKEKYNLENIKKLLPERYFNIEILKADIVKNKKSINEIEKYYEKSKTELEKASKSFSAVSEQLKLREKDFNEREEEFKRIKVEWDNDFKKSPFKEKEDFLRASLNIQRVDSWREEIQSFEKSLNRIKGEKEGLERQLKGKKRPQILELEKKYKESIELFNQKESLWVQADAKKKKLESTKKIVLDLEKTIRGIEEKNKLIGSLSDMASGKMGSAKISLERFVLMDLLDRVLEVASERLHKMSKGQYKLVRWDEEKQNKSVAAGLDLAVDDFYTGKVRPVKTLSGGESFLASLSLALALSDIVQRRSGGIQIDTLFIDEGFGSLDQESLQLAIDTLKDLHTSGRSIGIISHVTELKEQIPLRVDVHNSRRGSEISLSI